MPVRVVLRDGQGSNARDELRAGRIRLLPNGCILISGRAKDRRIWDALRRIHDQKKKKEGNAGGTENASS